MKLYHYTSRKFNSIDLSKCDGFWMTTISPDQKELLNDTGSSGCEYCAIVEFDDSGEYLLNGSNYDVEDQLLNEDAAYILNRYDGFDDYAVTNAELVKILEWVEVK